MDKKLKVIHLYEKETNKHYYFGSISAIYNYLNTEQVGITYSSLKTCRLRTVGFYENKKVVIRQSYLLTKPKESKQPNNDLKQN
jgi:hypothetical protein